MFTRLFALIVGVALLGLTVTSAAAAPVAPPTPEAVRCIPFTNICSGATVQNDSSVQFGVRGEDIDTRRGVDRVLAQGQNSFDDARIIDADFIYSSVYRIYDSKDRVMYNPGQNVKISDLQNARAVNGRDSNGQFVIYIFR